MRFSFSHARYFINTRVTGLASALCLLVVASALSQEPGQTPLPKDAAPSPEIPEEELVRLDRKLPQFQFVEDDAPFINRGNKITNVRRQTAAILEQQAYDYVLNFAKRQPVERLKKYSLKDVPVENLYRNIRSDYLRELIHVEGKLALIQSMKPTDDLREMGEIEQLYEVWVFPRGTNKLFCVVVSELPPGLKPGEHFDEWVSFDAYFFKLWHYESRRKKEDSDDPEKHQWERAPLFLGKTVQVLPPPPEEPVFSSGLVAGIVGGLGAIGATIALLAFWFRKGDQYIRAQAREKIASQVTFDNIPDSPSPANRISDQP